MNIEETLYHDYLLPKTATDCASSWDRIVVGNPNAGTETTYEAYWSGLSTLDRKESEYAIFSSLYDLTDILSHQSYVDAFNVLGYDLEVKCKRKKRPAV